MSAWKRATKQSPCVICGGDHACSVVPDGVMILCRRKHEPAPGHRYLGLTANGEWGMHVPDTIDRLAFWNGIAASTRGRKPKLLKVEPTLDFAKMLADRPASDAEVDRLSDTLGLPAWALRQLEVGYGVGCSKRGKVWLFPERDPAGNIVGLLQRLKKPLKDGRNKIAWTGGRRGLHYVPGADRTGIVPVVEGPTDLAALLAMGFPGAVGRPSNSGRADMLADLLGPGVAAGTTEVIIFGENDQREVEPGKDPWPGRSGAMKVAGELAERWGVPVGVAFPPEEVAA